MKKLLITSLILISTTLAAQNQPAPTEQEKDYSLARVGTKAHGVYMFFGVEPYYKYTYVATIKVKINWSGTIYGNFEKRVKKSKKKYPYFNAIIFQSNDLGKADLVRFDEPIAIGGFTISQNVSFIKDDKLIKGTIVELDQKKASIQYTDTNGIKQIETLKHNQITPE